MTEIEVTEYVQLKILEEKIQALHRAYDEDKNISDDTLYMIFGWKRKNKETFSMSTSPAVVTAPDPLPPFVKKTAPAGKIAPIGNETAAAIKRMFVDECRKPKEIAEALDIGLSTVYSYLKKQGLDRTSSMTEISGPVPGAGK